MNARTTLTAALLGTAILTAGSASAGLVAHWDFDSDFTDTTGNWDGTAQGTTGGAATIDNASFQIGGGSARFDGVDDAVVIGDLDLTSAGYTLSAWINMPVAPSNDYIAGKEDSFHLGIRTGQNLWVSARTAGGFVPTGNDGATVPLNTWTHVAVVYDGANLLRYINGALDNTDTDPAQTGNLIVGADRPFWIGSASFSASREFNGNIDDVALFDEALSSADLLAIYTGGLAGNDAATVIPEPGSMALLCLGGLLALKRRRQG